jgi:hypothetical protein
MASSGISGEILTQFGVFSNRTPYPAPVHILKFQLPEIFLGLHNSGARGK